jgi:cbb3-type cytochrome oxidase subunit 3
MQIIFLTAFLTSLLVLFFIILYVREQGTKKRTASPERAALLPLQDDSFVSITSKK